MNGREVAKYLRRGRLLPVEPAPLDPACRDLVTIPVCDELDYLGATLASLAAAESIGEAAVLLVVNHPADAPEPVVRSTALTLEKLRCGEFRLPHLHWIAAPGLTGGVGEARRLGLDAAAAALPPEELETVRLYSLDADSTVEPDYFTAVRAEFARHPAVGGLSLGVRHQRGTTAEEERAIRFYEQYMNRYTAKLAEAGSPYAFHTIGSAFAVKAAAYIRCGGMRVRTAAEDFYFLEALAKAFGVFEIDRVLVHPSARPSARVPFGTGRAVRTLLAGETLETIPDAAFEVLKAVLAVGHDPARLTGAETLTAALPDAAKPFFAGQHFAADWAKILANTPESKRRQAFDCWFDGLRTLRLLHELTR